MVRKLWALLLTVALTLCVFPMEGRAATVQEKEKLIQSTKESYTKTQWSTGMSSLQGFCGKMTSYQLYHMGINSSLLSNDGNKQYDMYSQMEKTTGGYYINAYPAEEYSLVEALNAVSHNGTKDVYNIIVGFEWTNTPAGGLYGHACVINGILDGKVYFVESFYTMLGGPEGNVVVCSFEEFAAIFEGWTAYEGLIHFAGKEYADACKEYPTDIFVRTRFQMQMRTQPCPVGQEGSQIARTLSAGERLRVTALLRTPQNEWYYRVVDGDTVGYVVADTVVLERTNAEDMTLPVWSVEAPDAESPVQLSGTVRSQNGMIDSVEVVVSKYNGAVVMRQSQTVNDFRKDLADLNQMLDFSSLEEGAYTVSIYGTTASAYAKMDALTYSNVSRLLGQKVLLVGEAQMPAQARNTKQKEDLDGWYWRDGTWCFYKKNKPKTGWYKDLGVWYYLQSDGSVTTGKATIDGQEYLFSSNGALRVGWMETGHNTRYMLTDGKYAVGWRIIEGSRYYFDADGNMMTRGSLVDAGVTYDFQKDGKAVARVEKAE